MASVLELILRTKKQGTAAKDTEKELSSLEKLAGKVSLAFIAIGAANVIKSSTMLAARVETLGVVTKKLGENVGMTEREVRSLERAIASQGITLQASRQAIAMMIQANVDLAHSTDLARLAQDTAVIAGINSSEAFEQLVYVLQTGNVRMARTLGLNVQFGQAQKELAAELGKTTEELSEQEIMQARTNAVMEAGSRIAGTYEAAMGTAGKTILSMERPLEELSRIFGEAFLPVLEPTVTGLYNLLTGLTKVRTAMEEHTDEMIYGQHTYEEYYAEAERLTGHMEASAWVVDALTQAEWNLKRATEGVGGAIDGWNKSLTEVIPEVASAGRETEGLTEAQYYEMAAEALLAGNTRLAQYYVDMATETGAAKRETLELIAALEALDGMSVSYNMVGFHQGMGGPSWLDQGLGGQQQTGGSTGIPEGGFATYAAGEAAGMKFVDGKWVPRQHGGPVSAGGSYIVGEREAELFVPNQSGHIYNQQQLAGGDININTGIAQRAFNNMAEDWMRGLGG